MKLHLYASALIMLFLAACQTPHQRLAKLWLYTHYSGNSKTGNTSFSPASFLLLQPDGTCTMETNRFQTGHWTLVDDHLTLINDQRQYTTYLMSTDGHELRLTTPKQELINFESAPVNMQKDPENPFAVSNNQWRIKATHPENTAELKRRLKNHIQFWLAYFTWAYNNHLDNIDVRSMPTPIKIYSNGFTVKPPKDLPKKWIDLFYDEKDCLAANEQLENEVRAANITWPHTDNKFKMFIGVFEQLLN